MIRRNHYLREDQVDFLDHLLGTESEHIRKAIDDYIQKLKDLEISTSKSKRVGEDQHG